MALDVSKVYYMNFADKTGKSKRLEFIAGNNTDVTTPISYIELPPDVIQTDTLVTKAGYPDDLFIGLEMAKTLEFTINTKAATTLGGDFVASLKRQRSVNTFTLYGQTYYIPNRIRLLEKQSETDTDYLIVKFDGVQDFKPQITGTIGKNISSRNITFTCLLKYTADQFITEMVHEKNAPSVDFGTSFTAYIYRNIWTVAPGTSIETVIRDADRFRSLTEDVKKTFAETWDEIYSIYTELRGYFTRGYSLSISDNNHYLSKVSLRKTTQGINKTNGDLLGYSNTYLTWFIGKFSDADGVNDREKKGFFSKYDHTGFCGFRTLSDFLRAMTESYSQRCNFNYQYYGTNGGLYWSGIYDPYWIPSSLHYRTQADKTINSLNQIIGEISYELHPLATSQSTVSIANLDSKLTSDANVELFGTVSQNSADVDYKGHHTWNCIVNTDKVVKNSLGTVIYNDYPDVSASTLYYLEDGVGYFYIHPRMDIVRQNGVIVDTYSSSYTYNEQPAPFDEAIEADLINAPDTLNISMCTDYALDNISKVASSNQINQTKDTAYIEFECLSSLINLYHIGDTFYIDWSVIDPEMLLNNVGVIVNIECNELEGTSKVKIFFNAETWS